MSITELLAQLSPIQVQALLPDLSIASVKNLGGCFYSFHNFTMIHDHVACDELTVRFYERDGHILAFPIKSVRRKAA